MSPKMELLFLFSFMIIGINVYSTNGCFEMERRALLTFKARINHHGNLLTSWNDHDCCNWSGVVCNDKTGHVVRLNLSDPNSDNYLSGNIDPSLLHLRHLTHLDLSYNDFSEISVPEFIGSFEHLICLNLYNSWFSGVIPYTLGNLSKLRYLDLGASNFIGTIPTQLGNLSNLQYLSLDYAYGFNGFHVGHISRISRLSSLRYLDMSHINLSEGADWSELKKMSSLETLILSECDLSSIPSVLSHINFTSLQKVDLSSNSFNTILPNWFCNLTNMLYLDLSWSTFYGRIPNALGNLVFLKYLDLSGNNIDTTSIDPVKKLDNLRGIGLTNFGIGGDVADLIRRLSFRWYDLEIVRLGGNKLQGNISSWITQMKNLTFLDLRNNSLRGPITHEIGTLGRLIVLELSNNCLSGAINEDHFAKLSQLAELSLSDNLLTMNVRDKWIPPFQLRRIFLSSCDLGPRFPHWIQWQTQLDWLVLSKTSIVDTIPNWLWSLPLTHLDFSNNNIKGNMISGPLPTKMNLSSIFFLWLSGNKFSGTIPSYICDMQGLGYLSLSNNTLSGQIPSCWNKTNLIMMDLSNNNLTGELPSSIGYLTNLKILQLDNNKLYGEIPLTLKKCENLAFLGLGRNKLSGKIPTWIGTRLNNLVIIQLRSNMFSGFIPRELGQLASLQVLDLAHNNFMGSIPDSFGNLSAMRNTSHHFYFGVGFFGPHDLRAFMVDLFTEIKGQNLYSSEPLDQITSIDLSRNNLSGQIPKEIGLLRYLVNLNLSQNHLIGRIPETIKNISYLECLDLSNNELSGPIPQSFSSLTMLNHLNLSYNNLSGKIPYVGQLDTFNDPSIYSGNTFLCGPPTSKQCLGDREDTLDNIGMDKKGIEMLWLYYSIGGGFIFGWWCVCGVLLICRAWRIVYFQMIDELFDDIYVKFVLSMRRLKHVWES